MFFKTRAILIKNVMNWTFRTQWTPIFIFSLIHLGTDSTPTQPFFPKDKTRTTGPRSAVQGYKLCVGCFRAGTKGEGGLGPHPPPISQPVTKSVTFDLGLTWRALRWKWDIAQLTKCGGPVVSVSLLREYKSSTYSL